MLTIWPAIPGSMDGSSTARRVSDSGRTISVAGPSLAAVGAVEVVEVLPLLELLGEELGVVDDDAVEQSVELLGVDAVGPLDLAVEPRRVGLDVDVADPTVQDMPMERSLELGAVVRLDALDTERQLLEDVVDELDGGLLVVSWIHPQHP